MNIEEENRHVYGKEDTTHIVEKIVKDNNILKGAEIGVWQGGLSLHLLQTFPSLMWIAIDPWMVYSDKVYLNQAGMDSHVQTSMQ